MSQIYQLLRFLLYTLNCFPTLILMYWHEFVPFLLSFFMCPLGQGDLVMLEACWAVLALPMGTSGALRPAFQTVSIPHDSRLWLGTWSCLKCQELSCTGSLSEDNFYLTWTRAEGGRKGSWPKSIIPKKAVSVRKTSAQGELRLLWGKEEKCKGKSSCWQHIMPCYKRMKRKQSF